MYEDKRGKAINRLQTKLEQYEKAIRKMAEDYQELIYGEDGLENVDALIEVYLNDAFLDTLSEKKDEKVVTTRMENLFDGLLFKQVIDDKTTYLMKGYLKLGKIKKIIGVSVYNSLDYLTGIPLDTSLTWLRTYKPGIFTKMISDGIIETILDFRIKKNMNTKSKRAQFLKDVNYKELFGVERALELHPCYFDTL